MNLINSNVIYKKELKKNIYDYININYIKFYHMILHIICQDERTEFVFRKSDNM